MNALPIIGWLLSSLFAVSLAVPFWFLWTFLGMGQLYFYWLPSVYLAVPFWHCVGLFIICDIIKQCFVPKFASVTQTNNKAK